MILKYLPCRVNGPRFVTDVGEPLDFGRWELRRVDNSIFEVCSVRQAVGVVNAVLGALGIHDLKSDGNGTKRG